MAQQTKQQLMDQMATTGNTQAVQVEVLIDIRDLLVACVQQLGTIAMNLVNIARKP